MTTLDANRDGRADLLIGTHFSENNGEASGSAFLVRGATTLADIDLDVLDARWTRIDGDNWYAFAGDSVAGGDVNGDGVDDTLVGAPGVTAWDGDTNRGRIGIFFGSKVDFTKPTVTAPTRSIPTGKTLISGAPVIRARWTGADQGGSGVDHYELGAQANGGAWAAIGSTTSTSLDHAFPTGKTYRIRVRAIDHAGNVSSWAYGTPFSLGGFQDNSSAVRYTGTWGIARSARFAGGETHFSGTIGRSASLTFTGRQLAFAAPTGPTRGLIGVYIDGGFVFNVNLHASTEQASKVLVVWSWPTSVSRTITIRVAKSVGHQRADIDKFIVIR